MASFRVKPVAWTTLFYHELVSGKIYGVKEAAVMVDLHNPGKSERMVAWVRWAVESSTDDFNHRRSRK
jgi:hypothetical protein